MLANTIDLTQTLCILAKTAGLGGFSSLLLVSTGVAKKVLSVAGLTSRTNCAFSQKMSLVVNINASEKIYVKFIL